jgi:hypothetical protein
VIRCRRSPPHSLRCRRPAYTSLYAWSDDARRAVEM